MKDAQACFSLQIMGIQDDRPFGPTDRQDAHQKKNAIALRPKGRDRSSNGYKTLPQAVCMYVDGMGKGAQLRPSGWRELIPTRPIITPLSVFAAVTTAHPSASPIYTTGYTRVILFINPEHKTRYIPPWPTYAHSVSILTTTTVSLSIKR
jgi:hypothetical protein